MALNNTSTASDTARQDGHLSRETELALIVAWQTRSCRKSRDRLLSAFHGVAVKGARKMLGAGKVEFDDLLQEACEAMTRALDDFDPASGNRFGTLAKTYVRNALLRYVMDNVGPVRLGTNPNDRRIFMHLKTMRQAWEAREGRTIDAEGIEELAAKLQVPASHVERFLARLDFGDARLDREYEDGDGQTAMSALADPNAETEGDLVQRVSTQKAMSIVRQALASMPERDRLVLTRRLLGEDRATREEIGTDLGISKERVRQLEARAVSKVKDALLRQGIRGVDDVAA